MAITLLLKKTSAKIGSVTLDASLRERHLSTAKATDHPVEKGTAITDHIRPEPLQLVIEGVVSNTPLPSPTASTQQHTQGTTQFESRGEQDLERAGKAYTDLQKILDDAETVDVVTALRTYENMALISLEVPRDAKSGQAVAFTATLKQIRTVQTKKTKVEEPKAKPKANKGKKPAGAAPPEKEKTIAKLGYDLIKGAFKK